MRFTLQSDLHVCEVILFFLEFPSLQHLVVRVVEILPQLSLLFSFLAILLDVLFTQFVDVFLRQFVLLILALQV